LDSNIYAEMLRRSNASLSLDLEQRTLFDVTTVGRYLGPRVSKCAQTTDTNVDYHVYPSGRRAIKWRIQKNLQINQKITLSCDKINPMIWPVLAALRLVLRARCLSQPDSMPVACYLKKGVMAYLTGSGIALHFRATARAVRPNISKDDKQQHSAQSMRVWACVLLDEARKLPDYIKKRLCWMGDSFQMYLHDTHVIQDQHREALRASSKEVMDLVSALPADILLLSIMSKETAGEEEDTGVYQDDMD